MPAIRTAYRRLALKLHPDHQRLGKGGKDDDEGEDANAVFIKIQEAYEFLQSNFEAWSERRSARYDLDELLKGIFAGSESGISQTPAEVAPSSPVIAPPTEMSVVVTLKDLFDEEGVIHASWSRAHKCAACRGSGAKSENCIVNCLDCDGVGSVTFGSSVFSCPTCKGRGRMIAPGSLCKQCNGSRVSQSSTSTTSRTIKIAVKDKDQVYSYLVAQGTFFDFPGLGNYCAESDSYGDVRICLHYDLGPAVSVEDGCVHIKDVMVSIGELFCGFKRSFLDGRLDLCRAEQYTDPSEAIEVHVSSIIVRVHLSPAFPAADSVTETHRLIISKLFVT